MKTQQQDCTTCKYCIFSGMHLDAVNQITELCSVLKEVYALTGEDKKIAKIINDALEKHDETI